MENPPTNPEAPEKTDKTYMFAENIVREQYHERLRYPKQMSYKPNLPLAHLAAKSGHGGGDFWMMYHFGDAIRSGKPPFLDVYRGVAMSIVGIQAWRSALNESNTEIVPDFHKESVRRKYAKDDWSPDPDRRKPGQPPPGIDGFRELDPGALQHARKHWKAMGYDRETWKDMGYSEAEIDQMV